MSKGSETYDAILDQALNLTSELGLEGLTIGSLANRVGMSKSGLYAHFQSKEALQCQVLKTAASRFTEQVLMPALAHDKGLPRLQALFKHWMIWGNSLSGGCVFAAGGFEYDDRQGAVRDTLALHIRSMLSSVERITQGAIDAGHLRADTSPQQFAFEYWGIILSLQHHQRLLDLADATTYAQQAFTSLLARHNHSVS